MKIDSVLVVYKRTAYELYGEDERNPRVLQMVAEDHFTVQDMLKSHQEHRETMERVGTALEELRVPSKFVRRTDAREALDHDLILTVGGDGTFLSTSHHVRERPMLGVNSSPSRSVGVFCGATGKTFKAVLGDIIKGKTKPVMVNRSCLLLNGNALVEPVLNEALIAAQNPATTSRYVVEVSRKKEHHKSSGIWVGPAAGSTAVMRAAGGSVQPITSKKVQWIVREPYKEPGQKHTLLKGWVPPKGGMKVWSKMHNGMVYIDGAQVRYRFDFGDEIQVIPESAPLTAFGLPAKKR